jgi:hypothetical protein
MIQLDTTEPPSFHERQLISAQKAYDKVFYQRDKLMKAVEGLMAEPHGCPMCHSGKIINSEKEHWDTCPFVIGKKLLISISGGD